MKLLRKIPFTLLKFIFFISLLITEEYRIYFFLLLVLTYLIKDVILPIHNYSMEKKAMQKENNGNKYFLYAVIKMTFSVTPILFLLKIYLFQMTVFEIYIWSGAYFILFIVFIFLKRRWEILALKTD